MVLAFEGKVSAGWKDLTTFDLHISQHENARQVPLLLGIYLQAANARVWQRQDGDITEHIRDAEPQQEPHAWSTRMSIARVNATDGWADDEKDESPQRDDDNQDVVGNAEERLCEEESSVEE